MVVQINKLVSSCDTNANGAIVRAAIVDHISRDNLVVLDFSGVTNVTTSFVNSAFVSLLPNYDIDFIKSRVQIRRVNRQIGNMIKDRVFSEAQPQR